MWQTTDGGYVSGVLLTGEDDINAIVLRLSSTGDIASTCGTLLSADKYTISNSSTNGLNTSATTSIPAVTVSAGTLTPYSSKAGLNTLCESAALDEY